MSRLAKSVLGRSFWRRIDERANIGCLARIILNVGMVSQVKAREEGGSEMRTAFEVVKQFLDGMYPDVGRDCPMFPVMMVVFSAAFLDTASVDAICEFTATDAST
jgi:hypothetical protein